MPLGTVQRFPRGLLELLSMRASGGTPAQIADTLVPVLDLFEMYAADLFRSQRTTTGVIAAVGFSGATAGIVPPGELWLLRALSLLTSNMAAGENYTLAPAVSRNNFGTLEIYAQARHTASGVNQRIGTGVDFEKPVFLYAGDSYGVYVSEVASGAHTITCDAAYYRLTF